MHQKSYKQNKFDEHDEHHVFANNFLCVYFFKTFSTDSKSALNSAFFDTQIEFCNKECLLFLYTLIANAQETAQKTENLFL
jgi:hypothetical protein